jgi:hypothetical protein
MPKYEVHLAIADKIYSILGNRVIENPSLFFCGNLAPDAYETKSDYQPSDKKHTHMCDDEVVHSYGYGYPEAGKLFKIRINEFIDNYYMTAGEYKDLYLGYIIHLYTDEIYRYTAYEMFEEHLKNTGVNTNEPNFRKNLADRVTNGEYKNIFKEISNPYSISINEYPFTQNLVELLDVTWDCEIRDYISTEEIRNFNKFVISSIQTEQKAKNNKDTAIKFIDSTAEKIIERIKMKEII